VCDQLIQIPMSGSVSSLNVSTVAAVLSFEVVRQRARASRA
jgi:tRNA G18 (ribose-2'-O)-methylase SpoU